MVNSRNTKLYFVSLLIIILSIFFQLPILYSDTYFQSTYGKDYKFEKEAGVIVIVNVTSSSDLQSPLISWKQLEGEKVDMNLTNSNKTLVFKTPIQPYSQQVVFNVVTSNEKASKSDNLIFIVHGDIPPTANAGIDRNISTSEVCNSENQGINSTSGVGGKGSNTKASSATTTTTAAATAIILDGRNSTDDNLDSLKYEWKQIAGQPEINLTTPTNVTTSFQQDGICNISTLTNLIFTLKVIDSKNQTDDDNVVVFINPEEFDLPDVGFEA